MIFKCFKKNPKGKESFEIPEIILIPRTFSKLELYVLKLINYHRTKVGLNTCISNVKLLNIADPHSLYMVKQETASHDFFPIRIAQAQKYCKSTWLGECTGFGFGTAGGWVNGWVKSKDHRKILESPRAKEFAISIKFNTKNRPYATLLLIER